MKNNAEIIPNSIPNNVIDYKNPNLPISERVESLITTMNLDEKIHQMLCLWETKGDLILNEDNELDFGKMSINLANGIGQIARLSDTGGGLNSLGNGLSPIEMAETANKIQKHLIENTRLGIPAIFHEEALHGLASTESTSYPQPIALASSFNRELVEECFEKIAIDARSRGAHQVLAPVVDVVREPRWGRTEETFGEDPYLVSEMGIAAVNGLQGNGELTDTSKVIATLKHFAGHGQPEGGTNIAPANYSERVIREVFLSPFKRVLNNTNACSIMPSYNEIDGLPSHTNKWLLKKVLREEWGFTGYLVSDYFAITELYEKEGTVSHHVAKDKKEAALKAIKAGVNIELPDPDCYSYLKELVEENKITEEEIENLIRPILRYKFELGLFENPYVQFTESDLNSKLISDRDIAYKAAVESMVLLKNKNNVLPITDDKVKKIAVIGPNADRILLGGYSGMPKYSSTVLDGIKKAVGDKIEIVYHKGCEITIGGAWTEDEIVFAQAEENLKLIDEASKIAKDADIVILAIGGNEQTSREAWADNHLGDRTDLDLIGDQNILINKLFELDKPIISLLFNGRPLSALNALNKSDALIECWYLGQETGDAVANVLFGKENPSGKLPVSIAKNVGHLPIYYNRKPSTKRGYLLDDTSPLFPFGFGLSYSKFKISNIKLDKETINSNESAKVSCSVTNISTKKGSEVIQMYIRDVYSSVTRPIKELKGFKKVFLEPNKSKNISFEITTEALSFYNEDMQFVLEPGKFEIFIGTSSAECDLSKLILEVK